LRVAQSGAALQSTVFKAALTIASPCFTTSTVLLSTTLLVTAVDKPSKTLCSSAVLDASTPRVTATLALAEADEPRLSYTFRNPITANMRCASPAGSRVEVDDTGDLLHTDSTALRGEGANRNS
jgi:hypothetical protein